MKKALFLHFLRSHLITYLITLSLEKEIIVLEKVWKKSWTLDPKIFTNPLVQGWCLNSDPSVSCSLACEQALLFGRAKRASQERVSESRSREGQRKGTFLSLHQTTAAFASPLAFLSRSSRASTFHDIPLHVLYKVKYNLGGEQTDHRNVCNYDVAVISCF